MSELVLKDIQKKFGIHSVLTKITFSLSQKEKIGIVGRNGTGKTTIFRIIAGLETYDDGVLSIRKGASIGYLNQIPEYSKDKTVSDVLYDTFGELSKIQAEMREIEDRMMNAGNDGLEKLMRVYSELQSKFELKGGYEIDVKVDKISTGLKFSDSFKSRRFNTLSGGEKTSVELGKILLQSPDILLLDEPTNNLDIESVEWVEEYIKNYGGAVAIISHDRYFLDKTVSKIIEIESGENDIYHGNYSFYVEEKDRRIMAQFEAYKDQQKKIKAMREAIERFRVWGRNGSNPKMYAKIRNMESRIEKMEKVEKPLVTDKMGLALSMSSRSGNDVMSFEGLYKSFKSPNGEPKRVFDNAKLYVGYKDKVCILGRNGSGKSTLVKMVTGQVNPDAGEIKRGSNLNIGLLEQHIKFDNKDLSLLETFISQVNVTEKQARSKLAKFLFYGEDVFKPINVLSGGELVRLKLCILMNKDINLLILDEPTNHLDIESREMLEDALLNFDGTILFISHDRYLINKLAKRIVEIENGKLCDYIGNYDYYKFKKNKFDINESEIKFENSNVKKKKKGSKIKSRL